MNAVVMDEAVIGAESIVGALAFVKAKSVFEDRSVIVGNPAKVVKQVSDQMLAWKTEGTRIYQQLPEDCRQGLREVEPLREVPEDRPVQKPGYRPWKG